MSKFYKEKNGLSILAFGSIYDTLQLWGPNLSSCIKTHSPSSSSSHTQTSYILLNNFKHSPSTITDPKLEARAVVALVYYILCTYLKLLASEMCKPKPSSTSPFLYPTQTNLITSDPKLLINDPPHDEVQDQNELQRWPTPDEV